MNQNVTLMITSLLSILFMTPFSISEAVSRERPGALALTARAALSRVRGETCPERAA